MADEKPKFHTWPNSTPVAWVYRDTDGYGYTRGVHVLGPTNDKTEYAIEQVDHHVSTTGRKESPIVYHYGSDMRVVSKEVVENARKKARERNK